MVFECLNTEEKKYKLSRYDLCFAKWQSVLILQIIRIMVKADFQHHKYKVFMFCLALMKVDSNNPLMTLKVS